MANSRACGNRARSRWTRSGVSAPPLLVSRRRLRRGLRRPVELGELDPQRRHGGERGDAVPLDRLHHVARGQVVERRHRGAGIPGSKAAGSGRNRTPAAAPRACGRPLRGRDSRRRFLRRATCWRGSASPPWAARSSRWCRGSRRARPDRPRTERARHRSLRRFRQRLAFGKHRAASGTSPAPGCRAAPALPISSAAPLSARICATCARLSSGLTGTWTSPARAAASGIRQVSSPFAAQLATRAPCSGTCAAQPAGQPGDTGS